MPQVRALYWGQARLLSSELVADKHRLVPPSQPISEARTEGSQAWLRQGRWAGSCGGNAQQERLGQGGWDGKSWGKALGGESQRQEKEAQLSWGWEGDREGRLHNLVGNLAIFQPGLFTFFLYPLLHSRMDRGRIQTPKRKTRRPPGPHSKETRRSMGRAGRTGPPGARWDREGGWGGRVERRGWEPAEMQYA